MAGPGQARFYSSTFVQTNVTSGSLAAGTLQFNVGTTTGAPGTPYVISVDQNTPSEELMLVTNISGLQYTVTRGIGGTAAVSHANNAPVVHVMYAQDLTDASAHIGAFDAVHGLSAGSLVVGTTDIQTLSNKTLTTPVINTPTINTPTVTGTTTSGPINSSGQVAATDFSATGLTGAVLPSRYVGATSVGAPASGTFVMGDWAIDQAGTIHICITGGTPGTWAEMTSNTYTQTLTNKTLATPTLTGTTTAGSINVSGNVSVSGSSSAQVFPCSGSTGATVAAGFVGGTAGGHPTSGGHGLGDFVVDNTGNMWVCTAAGTPGTWQAVGGGQGIVAAPTASSASGTPSSGTTETFDAVLGTYSFNVVSGRRYRVILDNMNLSGSIAGDLYTLRIRNSGSSSPPTTSSTTIAAGNWLCNTAGGPGTTEAFLTGTFLAGATGSNVIEFSTQRIAGTGVVTPFSAGGLNRSLYVEDIGNV